MADNKQKAQNINERIRQSEYILIISSRPTDPDCIASALLMKWYIKEAFKKEAEAIVLSSYNERIKTIPNYDSVRFTRVKDINYNAYNLVILVDGSDWHRFFGEKNQDVINNLNKNIFVGIDHHKEGDIAKDLGSRFIRQDDSCTAKIIYDNFIKNTVLKIDSTVATWIYFALVDDTGRFKFEMYQDTLLFADELLKLGANHDLATDENTTKDRVLFMAWAINKTQFLPDIQSTILSIGNNEKAELDNIFGSGWEKKELHRYYFETVFRKIEGYNYGVMFQNDWFGSGVKVGWRTRNYGNNLDLSQILTDLGFSVGGHFGSGGGSTAEPNIVQIQQSFVTTMSSKLQNSMPSPQDSQYDYNMKPMGG